MKRNVLRFAVFVSILFLPSYILAWKGMPMPELHVDGRYFKDPAGNIVNLHGFAQTYSPWFNEQNTKWYNYDVSACLKYNQEKIDQILAAGWKMSFIRIHMDPYWSNMPNQKVTGENDISAFSFERFKTYFASVFLPMIKYANAHGLYVVLRPPGVCPQTIYPGDDYQKYLMKVWNYVSSYPAVKTNHNILFELANKPIKVTKADGNAGSYLDINDYFQVIVDGIRKNCENIVLVPGPGWQSDYRAFGMYPITGTNVAYAVHCYPGWYNSGTETTPNVTYTNFKSGWNNQIKTVTDIAPVIVTEMDWAPKEYNSSWGKGVTGIAGGTGFGANFKKIADESGNVSWIIFTDCHLLAQFVDNQTSSKSFLTDPEACPWPTYHWYQEYAKSIPAGVNVPMKDNATGTIEVYSISGIHILSAKSYDEAYSRLSKGFYIINGKKVFVHK